MRRRSMIWLGLLVVLAVAAGLALAGGALRDGSAAASPTPLPPVPVEDVVVVEGRVVPALAAELGTVVGGRVVEVLVREGDAVTAGAPLLKLDGASVDAEVAAAAAALDAAVARRVQAEAAVRQAEAGIAQAEARVQAAEAARDLLPSNAGAARERAADAEVAAAEGSLAAARALEESARAGVEAADADRRRADAGLSAARAGQSLLVITAPFAGVVASVGASVGDVVSPGLPLVRLDGRDGWRFRTDELDEALVSAVAEGAAVTIRLDGVPGALVRGTVESVSRYGAERRGDIVFRVVVIPAGEVPASVRWNMTAVLSIAATR